MDLLQHRRKSIAWGFTGLCLALNQAAKAGDTQPLDYRIELTVATRGFDKKMCWVHARAGVVPAMDGRPKTVVMTMQKLLLTGSDVFYKLNEMRIADNGDTWAGPFPHDTLARRNEPDGVVANICDFTPKWHAATGKLLGTGHSVRYKDNRVMGVYPRESTYAVYDPEAHTWTEWATLEMPDRPEFKNAGSGCTQRVDLDSGDILLPVYFKKPEDKQYSATVVRCRFDGRKLTYAEHGSVHTVPIVRGFAEPSLTRFGDRFYLTLRNDKAGYVTSGQDGLHFDEAKKWTFDDGEDLGNYNTQQHWVTHGDALFLVYTRKGANNDHVFRHRAPLFIARVDPDRLVVLRDTERVLVPERGARLGNFGVVDVSPTETWVTVTEWMQPIGCEKYGSDNSVYVAKIHWSRPNRAMVH